MVMSDDEIRELIDQHRRDLRAFSRAKQVLTKHMQELEAGEPEIYDRFVNWAGTQAAMNVLIMCTTRLTGVIEDLYGNLEKREATVLKLVEKQDE